MMGNRPTHRTSMPAARVQTDGEDVLIQIQTNFKTLKLKNEIKIKIINSQLVKPETEPEQNPAAGPLQPATQSH